ncbi:hypothetical protein BMG00_06420 [Thioclava marina]|uniref:Calpastatin n=1 Tax=Thioclava marina TaxID=1915077 RepID=A0ABX3MPE2_9RHOB|nr:MULTISPECIES: DUF1810 domain-containing protein [Thioclava]OOY13409.1 hypothetical protein BMG00_06420 [Thioclava marina]OOY29123.1 hypothetical protein BMI90_02330 [Thioclava sp. L04-15]TNE87837.1 MAG: DUF1810 family protein [Paracoccaceae bacterium]
MTIRFHAPQARDYPTALRELRHGCKTTHWIWWIFPQLAALGRSPRAKEYGIADLGEARDYLADPVLRARLVEASEAVLTYANTPIEEIMGPVDALKLRSCATLFEAASNGKEPVFTRLLETFYEGERCPLTLDALAR